MQLGLIRPLPDISRRHFSVKNFACYLIFLGLLWLLLLVIHHNPFRSLGRQGLSGIRIMNISSRKHFIPFRIRLHWNIRNYRIPYTLTERAHCGICAFLQRQTGSLFYRSLWNKLGDDQEKRESNHTEKSHCPLNLHLDWWYVLELGLRNQCNTNLNLLALNLRRPKQ